MDITRRNALKIIGATPVAAGIGLTDESAEAQAHQHPTTAKPAGARAEGRLQAEVLHSARVGDGGACSPTS